MSAAFLLRIRYSLPLMLALSFVGSAAGQVASELVAKSWENWKKDDRGLRPGNLSVPIESLQLQYDPQTAKTTVTVRGDGRISSADMAILQEFWPRWVDFALKNHPSLQNDLLRIKGGLTAANEPPPPPPQACVPLGCGPRAVVWNGACGMSWSPSSNVLTVAPSRNAPVAAHPSEAVVSRIVQSRFTDLSQFKEPVNALAVSVTSRTEVTELDRAISLEDALRARDLFTRGQFEAAAQLSESAIARNPETVLGWTMRAICANHMNEPSVALESAIQARLALGQNHSRRHELYRQLERVQGNARAAFESQLLQGMRKPASKDDKQIAQHN